MKKLLTLITVIFALLIGVSATSAKPQKKNKHKPPVTFKKRGGQTGYHNRRGGQTGYHNRRGGQTGYYNRRGVYIYHSTRIISRWKGKYRNTYRHKVFPNGRVKTKLINSVLIRPNRFGHKRIRVFYRTRTVYKGWRAYRVTYKITRYPNGRVRSRVVNKRRIYV